MADILISKFTTQIPRVGATPATPGFAESEGQDPVAPSGTPQVYTPVTIGSPANGLSIDSSQVLTIGLASTSATGALSSTDWNTFNGKLNLTSPITGYTVGANTALAATDTILQAFGKVQGQINARISGTIASGQVAFGTGVNTIGGNSNLIFNETDLTISINVSGSVASSGRSVLAMGGTQGGLLAFYQGTTRNALFFSTGNVFTIRNDNGGPINFESAASVIRWRILTTGEYESPDTSTIRTATGTLTIATNGGNGNILLRPNGTGLVGINLVSPTNTLDVNGTARIRTISNLGSAATSVLVPSATGVVSLRTLAEFASDAGLTPLSGLTTNRIIKATSASTVGNTGITEESATSYLFGTRSNSATATPLCVSFGGTFGNNTAGTEGNLKWKLYDVGAGTNYGIGMSASRMEFQVPSNGNISFYRGGTLSMNINSSSQVQIGTVNTGINLSVTGLGIFSSANNTRTLSLGSSLSTGTAGTASQVKLAVYEAGGGSDYGFGVSSANFQMISGGAINFYPSYTQALTLTSTLITVANGINIVTGTTTGTRIGTATNQRLAFWNKTPIIQPTNAIGAGAFVANTSGIANDTATYGGYTMGQIAQALINVGILA